MTATAIDLPDRSVTELIAHMMATGMIHPGDGDKTPAFAIPALPAYKVDNLPPQQAEQYKKEFGVPGDKNFAQISAEALVYTLHQAGHAFITTGELSRLRQLDAESEARKVREITLECHCGGQVFSARATEVTTSKFLVHASKVIPAVHQLTADCSGKHRPAAS